MPLSTTDRACRSSRVILLRQNHRLLATYLNDLGVRVNADLSVFLVLGSDAEIFLGPLLNYLERFRAKSRSFYTVVLTEIGRAFVDADRKTLPGSMNEWQDLVFCIYRYILTNTKTKANLKSRIDRAQAAIGALRHLQNEGMIPIGVILPSTSYRPEPASTSGPSSVASMIGDSGPRPITEVNDKLLCTIRLDRTDAEYLDEVRSTLTSRRVCLRSALVGYWTALRTHVEFGAEAIASVNWSGLQDALRRTEKGGKHPCDPSNAQGFANMLALFHHEFNGLPSEAELSALYKKGWLPFSNLRTGLRKAKSLEWPFPPMETFPVKAMVHRLPLRWMLSKLSQDDIGVLAALLVMEHPSFTPEATYHAKITNRHDKSMIQFDDSGYFFSVQKHRAKAMKGEALSPIATEIVLFASKINEADRAELTRQGDPRGQLLFLPFDQKKGRKITGCNPQAYVGFLSGARHSSGPRATWIGDFCPELISAGFRQQTISVKRIRDTEGVLEWFRTGSIRAVAKKLGNTEKIVIDHYIPKALLTSWLTRLVRRFQNLWIATAAAKDPYLLEVTDFATVDQLHCFLRDMLTQHHPGSSGFAEKMHEQFSDLRLLPAAGRPIQAGATMTVSISPTALAALYIYQDAATDAGQSIVEDNSNNETQCEIGAFLNLATVLRFSLPEHENPSFRSAHEEAALVAENFRGRTKWNELFVGRE